MQYIVNDDVNFVNFFSVISFCDNQKKVHKT